MNKKGLWYPFTPAGGPKPHQMVSAKGKYVFDNHGNKLLDATAGGVACVILGHGRSEIASAVKKQLEELEYYCLFGYSHPRAEEFSQQIAERTPGDLNHVFFTNSGSEAVETALKAARAFWYRNGQAQKTKFISLFNGYHGMNFGGISIGGLTENRTTFGPLISGCSQVPAHDIESLKEELEFQDSETVAAIILEPVQAAGGVHPPPENYLKQVRQLCDRYNVLLILDEVVCGWGRLGHWFGGHRYDTVADIMTTAKGLTSAYIPMGATIVNERIHQSFIGDDGIEFMHGYTYSGHPAACAAGLAVIEILERENIVANSKDVGAYLQTKIHKLSEYDKVKETRGEGMLAAVEFGTKDPTNTVLHVVNEMQNRGILVRAQEDHVGIYPPLTFSNEDIDMVLNTLDEVVGKI
ncbi:MAG: aspartate aminotransferase family protein [Acidimicrobiales bacterium]|nr:aspartate aminotransferase family protein [Acidimicrobiales bacterium]